MHTHDPSAEPTDQPDRAAVVARSRRARRRATLALGVLGTLALTLPLNPTVAAFTAQITNSTNTAGAASLVMEEAKGATKCTSSNGVGNVYTCGTIDKYGAFSLRAGEAGALQTVTIKNTGSIDPTSFTMTAGSCAQTADSVTTTPSPTDACDKFTVVVKQDGTDVYSGNLSGFQVASPKTMTSGDNLKSGGVGSEITFQVSLPADLSNNYQGIKVNQPITFTFTA